MARPRPPLWLVPAAAAYVAYFALLIYCDLARPSGVLETGALTRPGIILFSFRGVQLVTLVFGIVVAFRRPQDDAALFAAWLLATAGVFSIALPPGWAAAWQTLPVAAGLALWLPYASTLIAGAILFWFTLRFARVAGAFTAGLPLVIFPVAGWHLAQRMAAVYGWELPAPPLRHEGLLVIVNALAAAGSILLLLRHYNSAPNLIERRRAHLVLTGGSLGMLSGVVVLIAAAAGNGSHSQQSLFTSMWMSAGTLLFLLFPLSLAYAILRYRLFAWSRAIRLGIRYAVARSALLSIVPLAAVLMAFDMWSFGDRPLRDVLSARAGVYWMLGGLALAAHLTRHRWLDLLDRTFFREEYDAKHILIDLVAEIRASKRFEEVAALAATRIARALHPEYLVIGRHIDDEFVPLAAYRPEKMPLDAQTGGVAELAVPVADREGRTAAQIVLGPRRSEEPYSHEDRALLDAIAGSLALAFAAAPAATRLQDVELPRLIGGGRYRLDRLIGQGGMGVVYDARDLTLDRRVAIKLLRDELVDSAEARARFAAEARNAARFSHPHIVTVFDFDADAEGTALLVMEHLEGHTLREEMTGAPLDRARAAWMLAAVASAVDAAHAQGLLHRDLKPENVFIARDDSVETVKVLDFGIAKPMYGGPETRAGATIDGAIVGTPRYMAPEQLAGGRPSVSWDLWAVAVLAFELVTGAHPFAGSSGAPMPAAIDAWFRRALAPRPEERYQSARDLCAALKESLDGARV